MQLSSCIKEEFLFLPNINVAPVFAQPTPYNFQYAVRDAASGNDYKQQESGDGRSVQGEYRVLLPDGRNQIVRYRADDATGFNADVQYEGQPHYPSGGGGGGGYGGFGGHGGGSSSYLPPRYKK
jgi:hypothetical protein